MLQSLEGSGIHYIKTRVYILGLLRVSRICLGDQDFMLFGLVLFPSRFVSVLNESDYTVSGSGLGTLPQLAA